MGSAMTVLLFMGASKWPPESIRSFKGSARHAPGDGVTQERGERVGLPRAEKRQRGGVGRVGGAGRADGGIVAVTEGDVGDTAPADVARVTEHASFAVGLERRVFRVDRADRRRGRARTVISGQQDARGGRVLKRDEVRLV